MRHLRRHQRVFVNPMNDELVAAGIGFLGAVLGSSVTGVVTFNVARYQAKTEREKNLESEQRLIDGFLNSILEEVETLWNRYFETCGRPLENSHEDTPFDFYYPVFQDFFTIYSTSGFLIGRLRDTELRRHIVRTYAQARGLVDSFRFNNFLIEKRNTAEQNFGLAQSQIFKQQLDQSNDALRRYGNTLRSAHTQCKETVLDLIRRLNIVTRVQ